MEADSVAATQVDANVTRNANRLSPLRGQDSSARAAIEFRRSGASRILLAFGVTPPNVAPGPPRGRAGSTAIPGAYLTVREAARRLKVSTATVYKACVRAAAPHVRVLKVMRIHEEGLP